MKILLIISLLILFSVNACIEDNGFACTMEFKAITIEIKDSLDNPVVLDDYYTQNNVTKEILRWQDKDPFWDSMNVANGYYLLVSDSEMKWTKNKNINITFFGFIDSVKVIEEIYTISDNICHIYLVSGKQKIIFTK
jgi:hypothetical protein